MKHDSYFQAFTLHCAGPRRFSRFSTLCGGGFPTCFFPKLSKNLLFQLLLLGLFAHQNTYAQIVPEAVQCNDIIMQMVESTDPNCSGQECNRAFFQVRLATNGAFVPSGGSNTNTFYLAYEEVSVVVQMGGSDLSALDSVETENCFQSGGFTQPTYSVHSIETASRTVSFQLTNPDENGPVITFTKLTGQNVWVANLFIVVMSTYPSVSIQPTFLAATYHFGSTKCTYPGSPLSPNYLQAITATYTAPAAPTALETAACLQFGTFDQNNKLLPVEIANSGSTPKSVRYLNFTFDVTPTNLMTPPVLTNFIQTPVYQKRIPIPGTNNYRFFVRFAAPNLPIGLDPAGGPAAKKKLFDLKVEGPQLQTLKTTVQVCFVSGQIRTESYNGAGSCKAVCINSSCQDIMFGQANYCNPPDFILRIRGDQQSSNCSLLRSTVTLGWNSVPDTFNFERIKITLKFTLGNGVSIANIGTNSFGCPASNTTCNPIGTYNNCFSINGNEVSFCFFPLTATKVYKDSGFEIFFNTAKGCVGGVTVTEALVDIAGSPACVPSIEIQDFPLCPPLLAGKILDEQHESIDDVKVLIHRNPVSASCPDEMLIPGNQPYALCACGYGVGANYEIKPWHLINNHDGYLTGVSTYDLVLISKHILGLELLGSPYKIIAADINKSNSVTTFDIVEIRKLILGIYDTLPYVKAQSWRYVDADYIFSNPANPFTVPPFPETILLDSLPDTTANFVAVKLGDVNNTHSDNLLPFRPSPRTGNFTVEYPATTARPGEYITLPFVYRGTETLAAFQLGLTFDPQRLELVGPSAGDLPGTSPDCFGLTQSAAGRIKVVWLAMEPENYLTEGLMLFQLTFRVLGRGSLKNAPLVRTDDAVLENLGFRTDGAAYGLLTNAAPAAERSPAPVSDAAIKVTCLPNPAPGGVTLQLDSPVEKPVTVAVFSAFGVRRFYRELTLTTGVTRLELPEATAWPAGVYVWKLNAGKDKIQGTFIKP